MADRWPVDDEVVEQMATAIDAEFDCHEDPVHLLRVLLARHRLVRLPEEPNAHQWETEAGEWTTEDCDEEGARIEAGAWPSTGRIRPAYVIPGQPIHVNQENDDAE